VFASEAQAQPGRMRATMHFIQTLAISAIPIIFAITLHEAAHGYAARHFGDPTAWKLGRITLNPLKHIDLIGTLIVPGVILLLSAGGMLFGWAKPVPVNFGQLRNPKRDMLWVAAAGPLANLFMALCWALLFRVVTSTAEHEYSSALLEMARVGLSINAVLMILNLLPMPPLDGGRITVSLLPMNAAMRFAKLERYGMFIIFGLLFMGLLDNILRPLVGGFISLIRALFGF
jgi:Zn-dependent protease